MSFVNVKKVDLSTMTDGKENVEQVFADVVLVMASLFHDSIEKKEYKQAMYDLKALHGAEMNMAYFLERTLNEEEFKSK
ncbi:hypothetical protein [Clostridium sp.]|uniref:hypothetical protein n=1 Tax=Clostridium sp. TaxID=1506 RepID=UPI0026115B70|nr:hypothetical protein [Clostridium sp.]